MKNWFLNLLFPRKCVLCGAKGYNDLELCYECYAALPIIRKNGTNYCQKCGQILETILNTKQHTNIYTNIENTKLLQPLICGTCLKHPPLFNQTIAAFNYQKPIDYLILNIKFNSKLSFAALLGSLMAQQLYNQYSETATKPEAIIPIPLHSQRLKERGFNQAIELALPIAKKLKIPIDKYSFIRIKNTQTQSSLKINERKQNVKQAFAIKKPINYKYVAIIDDVITSGNTSNEFCKILLKSGITKIDIWSAAKTHLK